ncbi:Transcription initiation factor TFIID subunit 3, partial [Ophiophagus hannah]
RRKECGTSGRRKEVWERKEGRKERKKESVGEKEGEWERRNEGKKCERGRKEKKERKKGVSKKTTKLREQQAAPLSVCPQVTLNTAENPELTLLREQFVKRVWGPHPFHGFSRHCPNLASPLTYHTAPGDTLRPW